jgi:phosphoglycolate phosphatase
MSSNRLKAIIWDWNGTLLDDVDYVIRCINRLLAPRHLPLMNRETYRRIFRFPVEDYYRDLGFDFSRESFQDLSAEFIAHYYRDLVIPGLHRGARELLRDLHDAGLTQYILSAMEAEPLVKNLQQHGVWEFLADVQGLDHIHATSKVEEGKLLLERIGIPAEEILSVGDTTHDLDVAEALGLDILVLSHGHQAPEQLKNPHADPLPEIQALRTRLRDTYRLPL